MGIALGCSEYRIYYWRTCYRQDRAGKEPLTNAPHYQCRLVGGFYSLSFASFDYPPRRRYDDIYVSHAVRGSLGANSTSESSAVRTPGKGFWLRPECRTVSFAPYCLFDWSRSEERRVGKEDMCGG